MEHPFTIVERFYKRTEGTIQILILIAVPVAIYCYGQHVTQAVENAKSQQEYVRIATGILSQKVEPADDQTAIRTWASDVLARYSPVTMTSEQRQKLVSGAARTLAWKDSGSYYSGGYTVYEIPADKGTRPSAKDK